MGNAMISGQSGGGVRIQTGSYVGTGTCGQANPCTLMFDFVPRLLIIQGVIAATTVSGLYAVAGTGSYSAYYGESQFGMADRQHMQMGFNTQWYADNNAEAQANTANTVYHYVAIG